MALDRITKKKVLKGVVPEVLLPEVSSVVEPTTVVEIDTSRADTNNLVDEVKAEIQAWDDLLSEAEIEVSGTVVPVPDEFKDLVGLDQYSSSDLQLWLLTGNTIWPDMVTRYEEQQWDSGSSVLGMVYGTILEVKQELNSSLEYLADSVNRPNVLPKEVIDTHRKQVDQAQTLRDKIRRAVDKAKKKLPECYIRKAARILQKTYDSNSTKSTISSRATIGAAGFASSKQDFVDVIRASRAILRYSILNDKVNWKATRKNLLNRFLQLLATRVLNEAVSALGQLQSQLNTPLIDLVTRAIEIINEPDCDAFDELIGIIIEEAQKLRFDYASKIYELQGEIDKKYGLRGSLVELIDSNVTMNKHLATLDIILESLDTILSSGSLDEQMVQYVKGRLSKGKSKTMGPGDFPTTQERGTATA